MSESLAFGYPSSRHVAEQVSNIVATLLLQQDVSVMRDLGLGVAIQISHIWHLG